MCPSPNFSSACVPTVSYWITGWNASLAGTQEKQVDLFLTFFSLCSCFQNQEKIFKWHRTDREEQMSAVYFPWLDFNRICIEPYLFSLYRIRESGLTKPTEGQCLFRLMDDRAMRLGSSKEKSGILSRDRECYSTLGNSCGSTCTTFSLISPGNNATNHY